MEPQFEHIDYLNSNTIEFVGEADGVAVEAQLSDVYALEVYREEIRREEQLVLDEAVALSYGFKEEFKLLHPTETGLGADSDEEDGLVVVNPLDAVHTESKPPPSCTCCLVPLEEKSTRRILSCGHLYCTTCVATRCRMGVRDRSMVPAHCCKKEFPADYVREALDALELETYERFLQEKHWRTLDLQSDREYALVVQQQHGVQCPGCGVGVQKSVGCNRMTCLNHHEFCYLCARQWKTCQCSYY
ncbi:unnamed protein product [Phytophthora lilii]|uniref:Unnamed protein product n=1 Tax=Phytophthora lilii TaxID=2077276 RepID=A0A9W6THR8_9STRA|nr:unnamed protein product [Phytophthora lilii]